MKIKTTLPLAALLSLAAALPAGADERHFTYSYEAKTLPRGMWEFEQWATLRAKKDEGTYRAVDFREELEYGLLDRLTTALYLNFEYESTRDVPDELNGWEFNFEGVSSEWKYKVLDPAADAVGLLLYAELGLGSDETELEFKVILNKEIGPFHLVYNFIFEFEWEKEEEPGERPRWNREYFVQHTFGVSWQPMPMLAVGLESTIDSVFVETFGNREYTAYWIGPNVHVSFPGWWATLTALNQYDGSPHRGVELEHREKYEVRLIVGFNF